MLFKFHLWLLKKDVHFLIDNCIPHGKNKRGEPISAADLFSGRMSTQDGVAVITYPFKTEYLTNLRNRSFICVFHNRN